MSLDLDDLRTYCDFLDDQQGEVDVAAIVKSPILRPLPLRAPLAMRWRLVAAAAVLIVAGVGLGFLLDGDSSPAEIDTRTSTPGENLALGELDGGAETRVVVSPLIELRPTLVEQADVEQFSVEVAPGEADYWRLMSLDEFDGQVWKAGSKFEPADGAVSSDLDPSVPTSVVRQTITVTDLRNIYLPHLFALSAVISSEIDLEYEAESGALAVHRDSYGDSPDGFTYVIESSVPEIDRQRLEAAPIASLDPDFLDHYTALPEDFSERIITEAERITSASTSDYDRALALQNHFHANFTYDVNVALGHDIADMETFLFEIRHGYNEQFAATYAAMARSIGLPTRVAVGFTWGDWSANREAYVVRGEHAHAWPEVYFAGTGWVRFEPTPQLGGPNTLELSALLDDLDRGDVDSEGFVVAVESWQRQAISDYQFTLVNHCECDDNARGPFVIIVSDGAFVEAFRDGEPVETAPTIPDLFAMIAQGLVDGVRVAAEYDWVVGYPIDAVIDVDAVAVDGGRSFSVSEFRRHDNDSPQAVQITEATTRWEAAGLTDYSYTFQRECFCPLTGPWEITVTNGVTTGLPSGVMGSIDELFEKADRAVDFAASSVISYDAEYGFPASANIDWISNAVDDEARWTVTNFTTR